VVPALLLLSLLFCFFLRVFYLHTHARRKGFSLAMLLMQSIRLIPEHEGRSGAPELVL
jgi:hypothetical protein